MLSDQPVLRVALIDDHPAVLWGLRALFARHPQLELAGVAQTREEGLRVCLAERPDVACVDLALQGFPDDGLRLCRELKSELADLRIVVYTAMTDMGVAARALATGAAAVVSKADDNRELFRATLMTANDPYVSPAFAINAASNDFPSLSSRQLVVLSLLAEGLESKAIAKRLGVGEETVSSHIKELRRKLGASTRAEAVALGLRNALIS
jgi:DNA-binding NarL/FixJ family response regulator